MTFLLFHQAESCVLMTEQMSPFFNALKQPSLLFIHGKGGVGKTLFTAALAETLNATPSLHQNDAKNTKSRVLRVQIDNESDLKFPSSVPVMNATVKAAFLKYAAIKLNSEVLAKVLLDHKAIDYLLEASPGIKEFAILSHIWDQTRIYDKVIVDMPSSGHAITLFSAFKQWTELFENSPVAKDAIRIQSDLDKPTFSAHLLMSIPEEMPLAENKELKEELKKLFPEHHQFLKVINKVIPDSFSSSQTKKKNSENALQMSANDFLMQKRQNEQAHLKNYPIEPDEIALTIPHFIPKEFLFSEMRSELNKYVS